MDVGHRPCRALLRLAGLLALGKRLHNVTAAWQTDREGTLYG
jgi:hypothetical protein